MSNYPSEPGFTGTQGTSEAAANKIAARAPSIRRKVWEALDEGAHMSGETLAAYLNENLYSVLPRLTEMQHGGMVRDSGLRDKTRLGGETVIWERVPGAVYQERTTAKAKPRRKAAVEKMVAALTLIDRSPNPSPLEGKAIEQAVREALELARAAGLA